MTIAIGLLASDGLVISADRQISAGGAKLEQGKVHATGRTIMRPATDDKGDWRARVRDTCECLVTGAGNLHYLAALSGRIRQRFVSEPHIDTLTDVEPAFAVVLDDFYKSHVWPVSYRPEDRPSVELIIGCKYGAAGRARLFESQENLLRDPGPYAAVGVGATTALALLERLYRTPLLDVWQTVVLAAYVMYQVKSSVEGCGKRTDIYCVTTGQMAAYYGIPHRQTDMLEGMMEEYCHRIEAEQLRWVVGEDAAPGRAQRALRKRLARVIEELAMPPKNV